MSPVSRFFAALAAAALVTLIAFAPSAALAHAGHKHAAPVETRAAAKSDVEKAASVGAVQEMRSADIVVLLAQADGHCGDRGCCGNGPCAGCCNALAPSVCADFNPLATRLHTTFDAAVPPGLATSGPPRPPRSFV